MSRRLCLKSLSEQEMSPGGADVIGSDDLETLAQLIQQIDDALLVVEHPPLAARVYAALRTAKAA
jgi:hypothetical protein